MDEIILQLLRDSVNARTRALDRIMYWQDRSEIARTIFEQESRLITLIGSILNRNRQLTFTFPINMDLSTLESVTVAPTPAQIAHELVPLESSSQQACSICWRSVRF